MFDIKLQYYGLYLDFKAFLQQRNFQYRIYGDIHISSLKTYKCLLLYSYCDDIAASRGLNSVAITALRLGYLSLNHTFEFTSL